ncbi:MAPEG family protein [Cyanobium sp. FGCU-52]|nr:MAPEG family protein [Cyanobium sp. FGCU52]
MSPALGLPALVTVLALITYQATALNVGRARVRHGALGFLWVGGRIAYAVGYLQEAKKRGPGFGIAFLASAVLLVMALVGALRTLTAG